MIQKTLALLIVAGALAVAAVFGCDRSPLARLNAPEQMTIFSIDGREAQRGQGVPPAVGEFRGYPLLGSVEITDAAERKRLIAALKKSVSREVSMAKCYWPRHALRAVENGQTVEYVLCFECGNFEEFLNDVKVRYATVDSEVRPTFDEPLQRAGVAIAPKSFD